MQQERDAFVLNVFVGGVRGRFFVLFVGKDPSLSSAVLAASIKNLPDSSCFG